MASETGPGATGSGTDVFDVRKVRKLVELMNDHSMSEIDLKQGDQHIRLRKGGEPAPVAMMPAAPAPAAPAPQAVQQPAAPAAPAAAAAPAADAGLTINSPMVGTFYSSSSPDAAPFVKVGDQIGPDSIVCIVEAMKVFNEIPAECSGKIAAILVQSGDAVEFGQPLFKLEP